MNTPARFEEACPQALLEWGHVAESPDHLGEVIARIEAEGVVLIRGRRGDDASLGQRFSRLFRRLAPRPFIHGGDRPAVSDDDTLQLAEIGQSALRVHCEMAYTPLRPDLCGFACEVAPAAGGETLLCDGREALTRLTPAQRESLTQRPLVHVRRYGRETWQRTFRTQDPAALEAALARFPGLRYRLHENGVIETHYQFWALTQKPDASGWQALANSLASLADQRDGVFPYVTWADGEAVAPELRRAIVAAYDSCTHAHRWREGEVLLIDNWRVLHGRNGFEDPRRRLLAMFGYRGSALSPRQSYGVAA